MLWLFAFSWCWLIVLGIDCVSLLAVFEVFWCLRMNFVLFMVVCKCFG